MTLWGWLGVKHQVSIYLYIPPTSTGHQVHNSVTLKRWRTISQTYTIAVWLRSPCVYWRNYSVRSSLIYQWQVSPQARSSTHQYIDRRRCPFWEENKKGDVCVLRKWATGKPRVASNGAGGWWTAQCRRWKVKGPFTCTFKKFKILLHLIFRRLNVGCYFCTVNYVCK